MKINHFPEDTDYDHDSAEYLLRTWGTGTAGVRPGAGEGPVTQIDTQRMNVLVNPHPDTEILWSRVGSVVPLPPPPLTLGRVEGGSRELVGRRAVLGTGGNSAL